MSKLSFPSLWVMSCSILLIYFHSSITYRFLALNHAKLHFMFIYSFIKPDGSKTEKKHFSSNQIRRHSHVCLNDKICWRLNESLSAWILKRVLFSLRWLQHFRDDLLMISRYLGWCYKSLKLTDKENKMIFFESSKKHIKIII